MDDNRQIDVRGDGRIVLYKRTHLKNPKWQVRFRIPRSTGYKIVTTGTADLKEAERFAHEMYEDLYLTVKSGGAIRSKTFKQVFAEWDQTCSSLPPTGKVSSRNPTVDRVRNYALPYFGAMKIEKIGSAEFSQFWEWRAQKFRRKAPASSTLRRELTSILTLFKFARQRAYVSAMPETATPKAKMVRRSTFTLTEWKKISTSARRWVKQGKHNATWRDRFVAHQAFLILANSGLRIGELRGIRWRDIDIDETEEGRLYFARVQGKTGKRQIVFQPGCDVFIERLRRLRIDETGSEPALTDLVICSKDGKAISSMKRSFESLLNFAGVQKNDGEGSRTIYSLRHFYATRRLSHSTSPYLLAKQMGTSVDMLERFYGHVMTKEVAGEVTRGNQRSAK